MQSFQGKLPDIKYIVTVNSGVKLRRFLEAHGCRNAHRDGNNSESTITVYCGGCYDYHVGTVGGTRSYHTVTAKEFKRIVREALGESK